MNHGDAIRKHLVATSGDRVRQDEILTALLDAFDKGGAEAVATELEGRLDALEGAFDGKLNALNALLS